MTLVPHGRHERKVWRRATWRAWWQGSGGTVVVIVVCLAGYVGVMVGVGVLLGKVMS